ncbi:tRNA(Met) cytidine acetyltransferase TmcA [Natronomonas moolapensis 8.8.11]|uniref:tRNA(Met) cytidine acetyltransferase TmcA n=2 Tax=Natronomonas moolapensis TaxID=416273 RepID=M1XRJ5_NATM8|nr:tRNA(Met) cytidine acetyltransferase TmcA [Natronomonas moolapensis]CCQ36889.1 tRNA(Met) cytidine acetyltransferase TmcA [Natronomonas moolapensis 8.8.11]
MNTVRETARELLAAAAATNERRLLVLAGDRGACYEGARKAAGAVSTDRAVATVSERDVVGERIATDRTETLLGTTYGCLVLDCHDTCRPNVLGQATGAVDGGGLLVVLTPPLSSWAGSHGRFDETLAAPPFLLGDVGTRFRRHLIETLRTHRGVSIADVDAGRRTKHDGSEVRPRGATPPIRPPTSHRFPEAVYEACRSVDQRDAVYACERLSEAETAVVLDADRGRGKSSAAGLAAAAFARSGASVLVTAPSYRNAAELFERAAEALASMDGSFEDGRGGDTRPFLRTDDGEVRFRPPADAATSSADVLFVDEAAAIPVRVLRELLSAAPSACFATTVRGYEGSGRGFDIRFRESLEASHDVTACHLSEPIRYAPADPIEVWLFHALLLDSTPPPGGLFEGATASDVTYERIDRDRLAANESLLRELFGLLVRAHYRTQPDDLARLLDAPDASIRALTVDGHPVSAALLSREGGLDAETRRVAYEGDRIGGNLIPDLLTSQLRDPEAAAPVGLRVVRIVTHHAVRSSGFGSRLLAELQAEFGAGRSPNASPSVDYLGVSYGATPALLRFWSANGYRTVHLSTTRNDASGEHSAVMLRPLSAAGRDLADRHSAWFGRRIADVLAGALDGLDPDVVRAALASADADVPLELDEFEWRLVASAADGPGLYDTAPGPFRTLALKTLLEGGLEDPDAERLLVVRGLQNRGWGETAERLGHVSRRACMRAFGDAYRPIVDRYGGDIARRETDRYRSG